MKILPKLSIVSLIMLVITGTSVQSQAKLPIPPLFDCSLVVLRIICDYNDTYYMLVALNDDFACADAERINDELDLIVEINLPNLAIQTDNLRQRGCLIEDQEVIIERIIERCESEIQGIYKKLAGCEF